jgi:hypothetical protein
MVLLGQEVEIYLQQEEYGAGIGTLTAGLAAWWINWYSCYSNNRRIRWFCLDGRRKCKYSKICYRRLWNSNCWFSFLVVVHLSGNATEEYDGTSWATSPGSLNTGRSNLGGAGTQTAGLAFGGNYPPAITGATEEYDGTSWATSPGSLNTARRYLAGCGIQTAALAFGGE